MADDAVLDASRFDPVGQALPSLPDGPARLTVPLDDEARAAWRRRIEAARARRDEHAATWDLLLDEYLPVVSRSGEPETARTNAHFRNVHTKLADLFVQVPQVRLSPRMLATEPIVTPDGQRLTLEDLIPLKEAVLSQVIGRDGVDVGRVMDQVLLDVLLWAGIGAVKVAYQAATRLVPLPVRDPLGQPVLGSDGEPLTRPTTVVIHERYVVERISPKKLLLPADLTSTDVERQAGWVGHEFFVDPVVAQRWFGLGPDDLPAQRPDDLVARPARAPWRLDDTPKVHGVEIWYRASLFDPTADHPEEIRQLVWLEGQEAPVIHRRSPYQDFDERGRLTADSVPGFPILVLTLRDLPDSPYPPSDTATTQALVKHLNTHRQQSARIRDAQITRFLYDASAFAPEDVEKFRRGAPDDYIAVAPGQLAQGVDRILAPIRGLEAPRDDWRLAALLKQDMEETLGLAGPQVGVPEDTVRTATEIATVQGQSSKRTGKERQRVLGFFLDIVRKLDALLQRFADEPDVVELIGRDGARRYALWDRRTIAGRFAYDVYVDPFPLEPGRARDQLLRYYGLVARDPLVNRRPLVQALTRLFGLDPNRILQPEQEPLPPALPGPLGQATPGPPSATPPGQGGRPHVATGQPPNAPTPIAPAVAARLGMAPTGGGGPAG